MLEKGTVVFGNWTVEERIGSGAFGTVYKIKREDFGAVYYAAMKVIRIPQDAEEKTRLQSEGMNRTDISEYYKQIVTDFGKEIQLLSTLDGVTNIVDYKDHVIEPNEDSGYTIYIKMQLLTPVSKLLIGSGEDAKFLSADEIIKLGKDMCSALEVCERKRIIHRDIKIDNIFVSEDGDYKLGDFGIARKLEATQGEMSKKGTLMYMAPEVFKGEKYDRTADIYSLGIVLYRLLNKNRAPFFPDYPQTIKFTDKEEANNRRLNGEVVPPIKGISDELNAILRKACAYNPRDRYQSASELKAALEGVGENVVAPVNSVFPEERTEMLLPEILSVKSVSDDTADEATVGIFDTAADVPVSENTETEAVSDEIEADEIVTNPSFDESDLTATQAIFANKILSDTIFEKETVTLAEPEEKTESVFSEAEEDEEKEIKESKEPKEPKKDKKKKKGALIIIIALILLVAIGVGIFFAVRHFSGKKDGAKTSTSTTQESSTDGAVVQSTDTNETTSPGTTEPESTPYLNSNGYYELCTADDLFWFAEYVNSGNVYTNAVLKNNINLNTRDWIPIGKESTHYKGIFNGNGYTVSGLCCNMPNSDSVGFFGCSEGTISNLSVSGTILGNCFVGGIVGKNHGTVINCTNNGGITGEDCIGGVIGDNSGNVENCYNNGFITGNDDVGGVVGYINSGGNVESCTNNGNVNGERNIGGIVGRNYDILKFCTNTGSIDGVESVGGVVGASIYGSIDNCTNNGDINGFYQVGGIAGQNYDNTIDSCTNSGKVNSKYDDAGGVVGNNHSGGTISNCSYVPVSANYGIGYCYDHEKTNCTNHGVTAHY